MCRIVGYWDFSFKGEYESEDILTQMRDTMAYGGPDDYGSYIERNVAVALGHRRLSIIDLSPLGRQPMRFDDLIVCFNGEIYNYKEIQEELKSLGYSFVSNSDTEVLLKAFHRWGTGCVKKFRGMWAFIMWDRRNERIILCRDRVGVKPLYWYFRGNVFLCASELKAFHKHPKFKKELNTPALSLYLQYNYITAPYTIFKDTYKLEPGTTLIINKNGEVKKECYWRAEDYFLKGMHSDLKSEGRSEEEIIEELEEILIESFKLRLVADVPVGVFLSGGIDSTLVTAILQKEMTAPLKTFTIGFHEKGYNEAVWARNVASHIGTDHAELFCTAQEAFDIIPQLPELYDEPFGDISAIPTHLVSKFAKQYVKVSLSADGGDELFCGYERYSIIRDAAKKLQKIPFLKMFSFITSHISPQKASALYSIISPILPEWRNFVDKYRVMQDVLKTGMFIQLYDISNKYFLPSGIKDIGITAELNNLHKFDMNKIGSLDLISQMLLIDLHTCLPDDVLVKVDRATMGTALEGRDPLLDHRIIEYAAQLPIEYKYRAGQNKYILRKLLCKYVPAELIDRPKQGFEVPIHHWLKKDLKSLYQEYLDPERIKRGGLFSEEYVSALLNGYLNHGETNAHKLWILLSFEMWAEKWL